MRAGYSVTKNELNERSTVEDRFFLSLQRSKKCNVAFLLISLKVLSINGKKTTKIANVLTWKLNMSAKHDMYLCYKHRHHK